MEELSIEEKARRYDDAINRMKHYVVDKYGCSRIKVADVFPELAESEDERIRKEILEYFQQFDNKELRGVDISDWIAWLEKQGEQKPIEEYNITGIKSKHAQGKLGEMIKRKLEMEKQGEQILANSAKTCKDEQKPEVDQHSLPVSDDSSLPIFDESIYHPCAEKVYEQKPTAWSEEDSVILGLCVDAASGYYNPDNKEKMKGWLYSLKDRVQPKQEWDEEDEKMIGNIRRIIEQYALSKSAVDVNGELCEKEFIDADNWLKSIRPQNKCVFLENVWHTPDETPETGKYVALLYKNETLCTYTYDSTLKYSWCSVVKWAYVDDLVRPQTTWKPSEEQIRELGIVATGKGWFSKEILSGLLEQLKKLKE